MKYLDEALHEYSQMDFYPFHMPGISGIFCRKLKEKSTAGSKVLWG
jgi:hypothetical protein